MKVQFIPERFLELIASNKGAIAISYPIAIPCFYSQIAMQAMEVNKLLRDILSD